MSCLVVLCINLQVKVLPSNVMPKLVQWLRLRQKPEMTCKSHKDFEESDETSAEPQITHNISTSQGRAASVESDEEPNVLLTLPPIRPSEESINTLKTTGQVSSELPNLGPSSPRPFFEALPLELRYMIYITAFCNYTIHLDLDYDYRGFGFPYKMDSQEGTHQFHARLSMGKRHDDHHHDWLWRSSICHRRSDIDACWDRCNISDRRTLVCDSLQGSVLTPRRYRLGALSWLLTCRQAYVETLDMIYRGNTFHMEGKWITHHIPQLIPPHRLASITALELETSLLQISLPSKSSDKRSRQHRALAAALPSQFPALKTLYIAISTHTSTIAPAERLLDLPEALVFDPIDAMVREYGLRLKECQITPAGRDWDVFAKNAEERGSVFEGGGDSGEGRMACWRRFWRVIGIVGEGGKDVQLGYWVRSVSDD